MTGDQQDILARLRNVLPARWFPESAPVLDALLNGLASSWSWAHDQLQYVKAQTRIATATDIWLDIIAQDFFGDRLIRRTGQSDAAFRSRIRRELFRERGTRGAMSRSCRISQDACRSCSNPPERPIREVILRWQASAGELATARRRMGQSLMPFQCFITAYRPLGSGIAIVSG